jgi:hypothetical protein
MLYDLAQNEANPTYDWEYNNKGMFEDGWGLASNFIGGKKLLYSTDGSEDIIEFEDIKKGDFKELRHIKVKDSATK